MYNFYGYIRVEGSLQSESYDQAKTEADLILDTAKNSLPADTDLYLETNTTVYLKVIE